MTHSITLERARALLHALKRVDSPAERQAMAELARLRQRWAARVAWKRWLRAQLAVHAEFLPGFTPVGDGAPHAALPGSSS